MEMKRKNKKTKDKVKKSLKIDVLFITKSGFSNKTTLF